MVEATAAAMSEVTAVAKAMAAEKVILAAAVMTKEIATAMEHTAAAAK